MYIFYFMYLFIYKLIVWKRKVNKKPFGRNKTIVIKYLDMLEKGHEKYKIMCFKSLQIYPPKQTMTLIISGELKKESLLIFRWCFNIYLVSGWVEQKSEQSFECIIDHQSKRNSERETQKHSF